MTSYLPSTQDGFLPLYVLLVGITSLGNVLQCYSMMSYTQRLYPGSTSNGSKPVSETSPATPLSARTLGTWTLAVGIVRVFAAHHMNESAWYQMSLLTNVVGLFHFGTEAFVYKTSKPSGPWLAPVSVASIGLIWHILQYDNYVKQ